MTKFDFKQWIINNKAQSRRALNENYNEGMCEDCGGMPHEGSCMGEGDIDEAGKGFRKAWRALKKKFGVGESVNIEGIYDETMMTEEEFEEIMYEYGMVNEQFGGSSLSADNIATNFTKYGGGTGNFSTPLTVCDPAIQGACHAFSKCTAGHVDDGVAKNYITTQWGNPIDFWNDLGAPTLLNQRVRNTVDGSVFIYKGIQVINLQNYSSTNPSGQFICGCNPGCTDPIATNYDSTATCDDGSCIMPPPGFSECQNCCCRSHMQAKMGGVDPEGNPIDYKSDVVREEKINPTIDAIYELMQLAEQRRRKPTFDRDPRDIEMLKSPYDFNPNAPKGDGEGPILTPVGPQSTASSNDPAIVAGPCAMSHYPNGVGSPVGGYMPDPSFMIDPTTGICECDPSDPNNIFGGLTMSGYMNLNPGTPNNTGAPNGTGAC